MELCELESTKWLHEDVSRILVPRHVRNGDLLLDNQVTDPVVSVVDVFHCGLVLRVLSYLYSRLVINEEQEGAVKV